LAIVQRVAMIGFTVSDMERSVSFYSDVLSFEKLADFQVAGRLYDHLQGVFGSHFRIVHMRLGDQIIELTHYVSPPDGRPIPVPSRSNDLWFQHVAIVVSDMDQAYEILQRHQVRQISPEPQTIPASNVPAAGIKAIKFRDPDNHDLELLWFPPDKGAAPLASGQQPPVPRHRPHRDHHWRHRGELGVLPRSARHEGGRRQPQHRPDSGISR
jgi:catechol 2,3-dioxygenase-like lactoylglutathione lyase family enzyme